MGRRRGRTRALNRRRLLQPATLEGAGVHLGLDATCTVSAAPWGQGLRLGPPEAQVPVHLDHASLQPGSTQLAGVRTVEHVLAALVGLGITDAVVTVEGPELPILDGSAEPWCQAFGAAGLETGPRVTPLRLDRPVSVEAAGGSASYAPDDDTWLEVDVQYDPAPRGGHRLRLDPQSFVDQVCWARTFVLPADIERLRAAGRGRGATVDNTVIVGQSPMRHPDEPIRHKLLDLIGDLALLGRPIQGEIHVKRGSHQLHHALVHALLTA